MEINIENPIFFYNFDDQTPQIDHNLKRILESDDKETFTYASAALLAFVQANFTGPDLDFTPNLEGDTDLMVDGEETNVNVKWPALLVVSKKFFEKLAEAGNSIHQLWYLRCIIIHQKIIPEYCATLYEAFKEVSAKILAQIKDFPLKDQVLTQLEIVQGYLHYRRVSKAEELLNSLCTAIGIEVEVTGALGVRTKFQTKALPQLTLVIEGDQTAFLSSEMTHGSVDLPKLLTLDDDVRLERVKFNEDSNNVVHSLQAVIQCLVLTKLKLLQTSKPKEVLSDEEINPYIISLLHQDFGPWLVRLQALLTNIKQESSHRRTVERSLKQCEEIVNLINNAATTTTTTPALSRFSYLFSSFMIPRWQIESQLGDLMISLGMFKTALDLYLRLQQWDDVIVCYTVLDLSHKAADVIRQELEKKPTVQLYCLLGDATRDTQHYETAWEFSGHKSGRAQRHWGNFYFAQKEYAKALPYLEKTLELNSLQEIQWLRLGYAALQLENWELAAKAYRHYTHLEPNGFESWNNLAKAYIHLGDKRRAHAVLQEALKCNFNNWKIWENFLLVSVDVGSFEDAINAYTRLTEIKEGKYHDRQILEIITNAVVSDVEDCYGKNAGRLKKKCLQVLAQQSAQNPTSGYVWEFSAKLTDEPLFRAQKLQKAHRGFTQTQSNWSKEEASCDKVVTLCLDLCEASIEAAKDFREGEKMNVLSQLSSARLATQGSIKVVRNENFEGLNEKLDQLEICLTVILDLLKKLNS